jgi:hypothetical protein
MLLKILYEFKTSHGGTPEPHMAHDTPWLHRPSLIIQKNPHVEACMLDADDCCIEHACVLTKIPNEQYDFKI